MKERYDNFTEFYPYYLSQHKNHTCRRLHFMGILIAIVLGTYFIITRQWWGFLTLPVVGYSFAFIGHFFFEKKTPGTIFHPLYSFIADLVMFKDILLGKIEH
jgi:hypothetical protein